MGIKISEMIEANDLQDECFIPIVQNNINKKNKKRIVGRNNSITNRANRSE